ncbi:MAG: hypothetical protein ABJB33_08110, partial [Gemmatimonadota bacterium]
MRAAAAGLALLLTAGCAVALGPPKTLADALPVALYDTEGRHIGTAVLTADSTGLRIALDVAGLPPGPHAVHRVRSLFAPSDFHRDPPAGLDEPQPGHFREG